MRTASSGTHNVLQLLHSALHVQTDLGIKRIQSRITLAHLSLTPCSSLSCNCIVILLSSSLPARRTTRHLSTCDVSGAKQITLEGVYHSPLGATLPSPDGLKPGRPWYGSADVVDRWVAEVTRDASELAGAPSSPPPISPPMRGQSCQFAYMQLICAMFLAELVLLVVHVGGLIVSSSAYQLPLLLLPPKIGAVMCEHLCSRC